MERLVGKWYAIIKSSVGQWTISNILFCTLFSERCAALCFVSHAFVSHFIIILYLHRLKLECSLNVRARLHSGKIKAIWYHRIIECASLLLPNRFHVSFSQFSSISIARCCHIFSCIERVLTAFCCSIFPNRWANKCAHTYSARARSHVHIHTMRICIFRSRFGRNEMENWQVHWPETILTSLCGFFFVFLFIVVILFSLFRSFWRAHYLFFAVEPNKQQQQCKRMCLGFRFIIKNKYCRWIEALAHKQIQHTHTYMVYPTFVYGK